MRAKRGSATSTTSGGWAAQRAADHILQRTHKVETSAADADTEGRERTAMEAHPLERAA